MLRSIILNRIKDIRADLKSSKRIVLISQIIKSVTLFYDLTVFLNFFRMKSVI